MKTKIPTTLKNIVIQTIPVIIGVYLGLIANDLSQNKKEQQRTQSMKERLLHEIEANHNYLNDVISYHQFLMDTSNALVGLANIDNLQKPAYWQGFKTKRLNESAYQATLLTGTLSNFEIDELEIISEIYTAQAYYNQFTSQMISNFSNKSLNSPEGLRDLIAFINTSVTDIYYMEKELIEYYQLAKVQLNKKE